MQRLSLKAILAASAIILLAAPAAADFSIQAVSEPADFQIVSPNSKIGQFVRLVDGEGDPVNESRLEARENLVFQYNYNGTPNRMDYISNGYYYATFRSNGTGRTVSYELIDESPTSGSEVNLTEHLKAGKLDVDLITDFSTSEKAGKMVTVTAGINNLMQYYAVDVDDSGGINDPDEFIIDRGGSGKYSEGADLLLAGTPPTNEEELTGSNPWSGVQHPVMVNDSMGGDGWDDSNDIILVDRNSGGTVSTGADRNVNTGQNDEVETTPGDDLKTFSTVSSSIYFVSDDQQLDQGEEIIYDNDSDSIFTRRQDMIIAGNEPNEGTTISFTDSIPASMDISSYDANAGDTWDGTVDVLARDHDQDGMYSARVQGDRVLNGSTPSEGEELQTKGVGQWEDAGTDRATAGEVEVYDDVTGDGWDPANDGMWRESGQTPGYQPPEDTLLAGTLQSGIQGTENADRLKQWNTISAYRGDSDQWFNKSEDAIVRDWHKGGTYSTKADFVVAGSVTGSINAGTSYTQKDGFDSDWSLDVVDASQGGVFSSNQDTILKDINDGGTYSTQQDTVINSGGQIDASGGETIYKLSNYASESQLWSDVDESSSFTAGDEIFLDRDSDGQYTSRSDTQLAGISLNTAGAGRGLESGNPWSSAGKPILFYNNDGSGGWNSSEDALLQDLDEDGKYTAFGDTIVSDEEGEIQASAGDDLLSTDRTDFETPEVTIRFSNGSMTTEPVELGKKPEGNFTNTVEIPDVPGSTFLAQVRAETPISDLEGTESAVMSTRKRGIGFSANNSIALSLNRAGIYSENVTLENFLDEQNRIEINVSDSLKNITEAPETVTIPATGTKNAQFEFNVTPLGSKTGSITFLENETGLTDSTEVDINSAGCQKRTKRICVDTSGFSVLTEERMNRTRNLVIQNIWRRGEPVDVSAEITGGISSYIALNETSITFEDSGTLELTFNPTKRGNYSGSLRLTSSGETVDLNLELEAEVKKLNKGMTVTPSNVNLGTVPSGSDQSFTLEIENTGSLEITDLNVTSDQLSLSSDIQDSLAPGKTLNFSVTAKSMNSEKGTTTIKGQTSEGEVSASTEVTSKFVKPLSEMKQKINSRISSLRTKASSTELQTRLTNLAAKTSSIETQWQKGNYDQAKSIYESALTSLNSVESKISSGSGSEGGTGSGSGSSTGSQNKETPQNGGSGGGGGGVIIIVAIVILLILGAGFLIYTSYYPEEGDPLYDVLGDRE